MFLIEESLFTLLVLFLFCYFDFFSGSFQAVSVHQKYVFWSNNILCELREKLECYLSQTCIHAITAQYAARVLHFSASSLIK